MPTISCVKRFGLIAAALAILTTILVSTVAFFTARANETVTFTVANFAKDGYALERTATDDYFMAGESVTTKIKENNTEDSDIQATLTMSAVWSSPDPNSQLWSSDNQANNASLTLDGDPIAYTVQQDGSIIFDLPVVTLSASHSAERELTLELPENLKGTGTVTFSFDKAVVKEINSSWSNEYNREDLNSQEDLSYEIPVAWNISKNQSTKDIIAYLTASEGQYGLEIIKNGKTINTNNSEMMGFSIDKSSSADDITQWASGAPWYSYRSDIISVSMPDELTTIGDGAFLNLSAWSINQLTIGEKVTSIGEAAFANVQSIKTVIIPKSVTRIDGQAFGALLNAQSFAFEHGKTDSLALPDNSSGNGAFYVGNPYSQSNPLATEVYFENDAVKEYNWGDDNRGFLVTIEDVTGGTLTANRKVAIAGQDIVLSATPKDKYEYNGASYTYEDGMFEEHTVTLAKDELTFTMPYGPVHITPKWLAAPMLAPSQTWFDDARAKYFVYAEDITSIVFEDHHTLTGNELGWWDASDPSVPETVTAFLEDDGTGNGTYKLTISGNGYGKIFANPDSSFAFGSSGDGGEFSNVNEFIDFDLFDTSKATTMEYMFAYSTSLEKLDLSHFDTSSVTIMKNMFEHCDVITQLDVSSFDTGLVENMSSMFMGCSNLDTLSLSNFSTSKVKDMSNMFNYCQALTDLDITSFNTANVENMEGMFKNCIALSSLDVTGFNTSKVTIMSSMFSYCRSLNDIDVSKFDTSLVKDMNNMFSWCAALDSLDLSAFNTSNLSCADAMFKGCSSLTSLDVSSFDTALLESMSQIFSGCEKLSDLDLSSFNTSNVTNMYGAFNAMYKLDTVILGKDFTFVGTNCYLPAPSSTYITGATGKWYSTDEWIKYTPAEVASAHGGKELTYTAYPPALDSIEITTAPDKVEYETGENFDPSGMEVKAKYVHDKYAGFSKTLADDDYVIPAGDNLQEGTTKVTVSYTDTYYSTAADGVTRTDDQPITVKKGEVLPILGNYHDAWGGSVSRKYYNTEISFVDSYTPTGSETSTWDASDPSVPGTVTGYMLPDTDNSGKTKVIFAGNGSGVIYTNPDSSALLYNSYNLSTINGMDLLDTSKTTDMRSMFASCTKLKTFDISSWDVSNVTNFSEMFEECYYINSLPLSNWDVSSAINISSMFYDCRALVDLSIGSWDVRNAEDMSSMFYNCKKITSLDLSNWNTQNVTTMKSMFSECITLTSVGTSNWNTAKVTDMSGMFWNCTVLQSVDVGNWDTGNVTNMRGMFYNYNVNKALTALDVSEWDTGNVTNMEIMFYNCTALKTLDVSGWDTGSLTNLGRTFYNCYSFTALDVSQWDVSNVTTLYWTFSGCSGLTTLAVENWDVSNVTDMNRTFSSCRRLTSLNVGNWDTSSATTLEGMFYSNRALTIIDVATKTVTANGKTYTAWDTSNVTSMSLTFYDCEAVTKLDVSGWKTGNVKTMAQLFDSCYKLTALDVTKWDTSQVTNMSKMFYACSVLSSLNVSSFNTSAVINMSSMFESTPQLTSLSVTNFDTSNVTSMSKMFYASGLKTLDFRSFNTSKVTNMSYMFGSSKFTTLDLSSFDTSAVTNMSSMFGLAQSLTSLDISSFDFTSVTSYTNIFQKNSGASSTYKIYVKDATAQAWVKGQDSLPSYATVTIKAAALSLMSLDPENAVTSSDDSEAIESISEEIPVIQAEPNTETESAEPGIENELFSVPDASILAEKTEQSADTSCDEEIKSSNCSDSAVSSDMNDIETESSDPLSEAPLSDAVQE